MYGPSPCRSQRYYASKGEPRHRGTWLLFCPDYGSGAVLVSGFIAKDHAPLQNSPDHPVGKGL